MKKGLKWITLMMALCLMMTGSALAVQSAVKEAPKAASVPAILKESSTLLAKPRADAGFVADIAEGSPVKVSRFGLAWCAIEVGGMQGYVPSAALDFGYKGEEPFAIVSAKNGRLTLREKESIQSKNLGKFQNGNIAVVLEKGEKWTHLYIGEKKGYLLTAHLTFSSAEEAEGTGVITYPKEIKKPRKINFRSAPKTGRNLIGTLLTGTPYVLLEQKEDWSRIEVEGKVGYMMNKFLTSDAPVSQPTQSPTDTQVVLPQEEQAAPVDDQANPPAAAPEEGVNAPGAHEAPVVLPPMADEEGPVDEADDLADDSIDDAEDEPAADAGAPVDNNSWTYPDN